MIKKALRRLVPIKIRFALKSSFLWELTILFSELKFMNKQFYGNSLEDEILSKLLPHQSGSYIDIGSGRPVKGSNTFRFYRRGWRGILIDPLTQNKRLSRIIRPRDIFIPGVVSNSGESFLEFYEFLPYGNSTTLKSLADKQLRTPGFHLVRKKKIRNLRLNELCEIDLKSVTLLSIDTEGRDYEILRNLDFEKISPRVIVVEAWTKKDLDEFVSFLKPKGYIFNSRRGDSVIFHLSSSTGHD